MGAVTHRKRFLTIGYITKDLLENGEAPGGSALYSALLARNLGMEVHLCTAASPEWLGRLELGGIHIHNQASHVNTTFEHTYVDGHRSSRIRNIAPAPSALIQSLLSEKSWDIILLCPNWNEVRTDDISCLPSNSLNALFPQGWLRKRGENDVVTQVASTWPKLPRQFDLIVTSREDISNDPTIWETMQKSSAHAVLTNGRAAFECAKPDSQESVIPPIFGKEIDPTGAGDVFGTFLLYCMSEKIPFSDAVRLSSIAASLAVEKVGILGIPTLVQIYERVSYALKNGFISLEDFSLGWLKDWGHTTEPELPTDV